MDTQEKPWPESLLPSLLVADPADADDLRIKKPWSNQSCLYELLRRGFFNEVLTRVAMRLPTRGRATNNLFKV
jgi:hypothetical protein